MHFQLLLTILAALPQCLATGDSSALTYCSTDNTGSSFDAVSDTYQSNGACESTCSSYGLAILQYKDCWCANVAPATGTRKNVTECDASCPGYPSDACGSSSKGVYAYIAVNAKKVTSTAGGSTSTSGTTTTSSTTSKTTTSSTTSSDSTTSQHFAVTTSSNGEVRTVTIAASAATSTGGSASTSDKSSGLSGGSIAGIVIGVLGGLALVGALIFLVFFYRKRARSASPVPSQDMADRTSQGSNWSRGVFPGGAGGSLNRKGTFTDNRMNPNVVYPNGRRDSSVSLQDNEDYSRPVLRVTNAD